VHLRRAVRRSCVAGMIVDMNRSCERGPGGVIFDLDDTLVHGFDAERGHAVDVHYLSWRQVLGERGIEFARADYLRHMKGHDGVACRTYIERAFSIPAVERIERVKERCYRERVLPEYLRLRPGVAVFLDSLRRRRVRLGILTNAPRANIDSTFARLPLARWFAVADTLAADELRAAGLRPKPSPDGLYALGERLGLGAVDMLYVGDSCADVDTGAAAGVPVLAITANFNAAELRARGATRTFDSFRQLDGERLDAEGAEGC